MGRWSARRGAARPGFRAGPLPTAKIGPLAPGRRWGVARRREVVLRLLRVESVELLSRELGVPIFKPEQWRRKADAALDGALKEREAEAASTELAAAMQRIGGLSMENELLRTRFEATQALAMAVRRQFGPLSAGAARGLAPRHDHAPRPCDMESGVIRANGIRLE